MSYDVPRVHAFAQKTPAISSITDRQGNITYTRGKGTVIVNNGVTVKDTKNGNTIANILAVSENIGKTVYVISGYRDNSATQHKLGVAVDLYILGYTTEQTANAIYNTGLFNRVSSYTGNAAYKARNTAHADYRSTGNQGLFDNWVHEKE